TVTADPAGATVAFVPPGGTAPGAALVAIASLDPMGRDLGAAPTDGSVDYIGDARVHGDDFLAITPVPGSTKALHESTLDDLLTAARVRAEALGLTRQSRVLSTRDWTLPDGVLDCVLAVLAAGASLVQVTNPDPAKLEAIRATERTTVDLLA